MMMIQPVVLCLTCTPVHIDEKRPGDPQTRLFHWQAKILDFWMRHHLIERLFHCAPFLVMIALFCAFVPATRAYAVFPLVLSVLIMTLNECIPLTPVPFNRYNTVTSGYGKYITALFVVAASTLLLVSVCSVVAIAEHASNDIYGRTSDVQHPVYWSDPRAFISAWLLIAPIVYFVSLIVSEVSIEKSGLTGLVLMKKSKPESHHRKFHTPPIELGRPGVVDGSNS